MAFKLNEIADVSSGLVVSRKKAFNKSDIVKEYKQINLKAINKNGFLELKELENICTKEIIECNYLTHEGDIVIRLTDPFTAVYITKEYEGLVISSNFCIIRTNKEYNSEFLAYYLNSEKTKKSLFGNQQSSVMKNITMSAIEEINLPKINIRTQEVLCGLLRTQIRQIQVLQKLEDLEQKRKKEILKMIESFEE